MKRLLIILILLFAAPTYAQQCSEDTQMARLSPAMLGSVPSGCTTDNDSAISSSSWAADDGNLTTQWGCQKMTVIASDDITGLEVGVCDANADNGQLGFIICPHDETYDEPDCDGTQIAAKYVAMSTITNCGTDSTLHFVAFDSVVVNVGVTTVWGCTRESATSPAAQLSSDGGPTGRVCYASTGTPVNNTHWTCMNTATLRMNIYGCQE